MKGLRVFFSSIVDVIGVNTSLFFAECWSGSHEATRWPLHVASMLERVGSNLPSRCFFDFIFNQRWSKIKRTPSDVEYRPLPVRRWYYGKLTCCLTPLGTELSTCNFFATSFASIEGHAGRPGAFSKVVPPVFELKFELKFQKALLFNLATHTLGRDLLKDQSGLLSHFSLKLLFSQTQKWIQRLDCRSLPVDRRFVPVRLQIGSWRD